MIISNRAAPSDKIGKNQCFNQIPMLDFKVKKREMIYLSKKREATGNQKDIIVNFCYNKKTEEIFSLDRKKVLKNHFDRNLNCSQVEDLLCC